MVRLGYAGLRICCAYAFTTPYVIFAHKEHSRSCATEMSYPCMCPTTRHQRGKATPSTERSTGDLSARGGAVLWCGCIEMRTPLRGGGGKA
jgi:hypothetical protein